MLVVFSALLESFRDELLRVVPYFRIHMDGIEVNADFLPFGDQCSIQVDIFGSISGEQLVYWAISSKVLCNLLSLYFVSSQAHRF